MSDLIDTTEMYLRTVFELQEEGTPPLRARIAERLAQSGPTVSQTVARMERDGLLTVHTDRRIVLSAAGEAMAARVMRKHRLAECMLVDILGMDWHLVHAEACRWEHVMSDDVERRLLVLLDHPQVSPFGNPIPALAELAEAPSPAADTTGLVPLSVAAGARAIRVTVRRIPETVQEDTAALAALHRAGVQAGATITCRLADDAVLVGSAGEYTEIATEVANHVLVEPPRGAQ